MELNKEQAQEAEEQTLIQEKTKVRLTSTLGILLTLLTAVIAGSGVYWSANSYKEPSVSNLNIVVKEKVEDTGLPPQYTYVEGALKHNGSLVKDVESNISFDNISYIGG